MKQRIWFCALSGLVLLCGCAKRVESVYYPPEEDSESYYEADDSRSDGGAYSGKSSLEPPAPSRPTVSDGSVMAGQLSSEPDATSPDNGTQAVQTDTPRRLVHYDGYAKLRAAKVDETLDLIAGLATDTGGYVERLTGSSVTVRIPVDRFHGVYRQVLTFGDVLKKSVTAQDVSDAYRATDLRLKTARATRDRLLDLLAKAQTEEEKLQLLSEIQRVTEEIDRMESQLKTLASLASFSRLTVEVVPREAGAVRSTQGELAAFRWIGQLSPFRRDVAHQGRFLELEVPEGMVVLNKKDHWICESADGAVFWSSRRRNRPKGTSAFWMEAIRGRIEAEFASAEVIEAGEFLLLRLVDRGDDPYRYIIGVRADGKDLEVVEVYYPSETHEARYGQAVLNAITKGEQ